MNMFIDSFVRMFCAEIGFLDKLKYYKLG